MFLFFYSSLSVVSAGKEVVGGELVDDFRNVMREAWRIQAADDSSKGVKLAFKRHEFVYHHHIVRSQSALSAKEISFS